MGTRRTLARALGSVVIGALALPFLPLIAEPVAAGPPSPVALGSTTIVPLAEPVGAALMEVAGQDGIVVVTGVGLRRYRPDGSVAAGLDLADHSVADLVATDDGATLYLLTADGLLLAVDGDTLEPFVGRPVPVIPSCANALALAGGRLWLAGSTCMGGTISIDLDLAGPFVLAGPEPVHGGYRPGFTSAGQDADALIARGGDNGTFLQRLEVDGTDLHVVALRNLDDQASESLREGAFDIAPDGSTILAGTSILDGGDLTTIRTLRGVLPGPMSFARGGQHVFGRTTFGGVGTWSVAHATPAAWSAAGVTVSAVDVSRDGEVGYGLAGDQLVIVHFGAERARLSLAPPSGPGDVTVDGRLQMTDGTPRLGQPVTVERVGLLGATPVGIALADAEGRFSLVDPLAVAGDLPTYRARWLGDLRHVEGAFAILPRAAGARTPVPPPALPIAVQDIPLRKLQPQQLVVDEARQRLFVRGVTLDELGYETGARVDVYSYQGVFLQELVVDGRADALLLTPDQAHLLVEQVAKDQILVLDAATLLPVGAIATDPGLQAPGPLDLVGTDLVITGAGGRVAVPLADPTSVRAIGPFDFFDDVQIEADVSRPGIAYVRTTTFGSLSTWDLRTTPPTHGAGAEANGGYFLRDILVPLGDGPIRLVEGRGIVEHDRATMVRLPGSRQVDTGPRGDWGVKGAAAGPRPEQLMTLTGFNSARSAVIGPIPVIVDGELEVWDDAPTPYREFDILHVPVMLGATTSGSHAFVIAGRNIQGETGDRTGLHWLTTIVDPFARCSVALDAVPSTIRTERGTVVSGRVDVPAGTPYPAHLIVSIGTVHVQAAIAGDGRFRTSITPISTSATAVEVAVPQDVLGGCRAAAAVQVVPELTAPFDSAAGLVDRQAQDLLGRPLPTDVRAWVITLVESGAVTPAALIQWFATSDPGPGAILRLYLAALDRWPTRSELTSRVTQLQQGRTMADIAASLQRTSAFVQRFGQPSDSTFVTALYRAILGRVPTASERSARLAELARGGTRGQAVLLLSESSAYTASLAPLVELELVYLGTLRRDPTAEEWWGWLVDRWRGVPATTLIDEVRLGAEYERRIGSLA
jgi:hypothetical protein